MDEVFSSLERSFSDCGSYAFDLVAADVIGDMAYTVGYEHTHATVNGDLVPTCYEQPRSTDARAVSGK